MSLHLSFSILIPSICFQCNYTISVRRQSAFIIPCGILTSLLMGFVTFSILGHLAHEREVEMEQIIKSGKVSRFQILEISSAIKCEMKTNIRHGKSHKTTALLKQISQSIRHKEYRLRQATMKT